MKTYQSGVAAAVAAYVSWRGRAVAMRWRNREEEDTNVAGVIGVANDNDVS